MPASRSATGGSAMRGPSAASSGSLAHLRVRSASTRSARARSCTTGAAVMRVWSGMSVRQNPAQLRIGNSVQPPLAPPSRRSESTSPVRRGVRNATGSARRSLCASHTPPACQVRWRSSWGRCCVDAGRVHALAAFQVSLPAPVAACARNLRPQGSTGPHPASRSGQDVDATSGCTFTSRYPRVAAISKKCSHLKQ